MIDLKKYEYENVTLYWGNIFDCLEVLPKGEIQATITSPTYWGKRQFTDDKREFAGEPMEEYVEKNVRLYASILDILKEDGSLFFVMQDSFMGSGISRSHHSHWEHNIDSSFRRKGFDSEYQGNVSSVTARHPIIKNKSLCGIPYRIATKLVDMRYIWREMIIWEKPNPMPENITDRVRQSCEYIFHFTKKFNPQSFMKRGRSGKERLDNQVWVYPPAHKNNHTATFPEKLVERLMLATTDVGDLVLDPFLGSGTMLEVCLKHERRFIGCDINNYFIENAKKIIEKGTKKQNLYIERIS